MVNHVYGHLIQAGAPCSVRLDKLQALIPSLMSVIAREPVAVLQGESACFYLISPEILGRLVQGEVSGSQVQLFEREEALQGLAQPHTVQELSDELMAEELARVQRGAFSEASLHILRNRLDRHILPVLGSLTMEQVNRHAIARLVQRLSDEKVSATTMSQYMVIVRKLLKLAQTLRWLRDAPELPKVEIGHKPRSAFTVTQYSKLLRTAKRLIQQKTVAPALKVGSGARSRFWVSPRYRVMSQDMYWLLVFMVNSFVRPSDIKFLQHQHVEIVRGEHAYLRLSLPETKKHDRPIVSLQPAVRVYQDLLRQARQKFLAKPSDYVFLPEEKDRNHALAVFNFWLKWIMREAGLPLKDQHHQERTLYCLRHTAITFRLLYGQGIDMLTLARNARTSVDMIEKFYASTLTGEMNVGMLQSRRTQKKTPSREARG